MKNETDALVSGPLFERIEKILDEESAWIARPNREVSKRIALAAAVVGSEANKLAASDYEKHLEQELTAPGECSLADFARQTSMTADTAAREAAPERLWIDRGPRGGWMHRDRKMPDSEHEYVRTDIVAARTSELEARVASLEAENAALRKALAKVLSWAEQRCPCENDQPNPCPLCGASVENLEACKSAENTLPRGILVLLRSAAARALLTGEAKDA